MIKVDKLQAYSQECQDQIAEIGFNQLLADDSEFASIVRDIVTEDTQVSLLTILPSIYSRAKDEDSLQYGNKLMFFCVKKTDSKAGHANYISIFLDCQNAIKKLIEKFNTDQTEGQGLCNIGDFDFKSFNIDPVRGYFGSNGWVLSIDLITL